MNSFNNGLTFMFSNYRRYVNNLDYKIDSSFVRNEQKHKESCIKARKKRKKKRRK